MSDGGVDIPRLLGVYVLLPLIAYVIGSTPFGFLLGRLRGKDLRKEGSGNVGATNVGRVLGSGWGYLCFLLDVTKGLVPVLVVGAWMRDQANQGPPPAAGQLCWLLVGTGAIAGHVFTFWLKFKGGKGVATALGVVLGVFPYFTWVGLTALGVWIVVTLISRYVSLGSIVAAVAFWPLFAMYAVLNGWSLRALWPLGTFAGVMVVLIIVRHSSNIGRLLKGTENKIGQSKPT